MKKAKKSSANAAAQLGVLLLSFVAWLALFSTLWYRRIYGDTGFDSVLYTLFGGMGGVQAGLLLSFGAGALLPAVVCTAVQLLAPWLLRDRPWMPRRPVRTVISLVLSLALLVGSAFGIGLVRYAYTRMQLSELYENEYVDPNTVEIQFPEQKRNLVYIFLESMETSFLDTSLGGAMEYNLIPELTQLAQDNVNFSHNETVGGMVEVPGATWSIGAMVAQTAGVPLITPSNIKDWQNGYGKDGIFLPGLTSMSNILAENGYKQALMMGCDSNFGGERVYALTHQVDRVYDYYTGLEDGIVPPGYYAWWGFEDKYLFEYAKQELTALGQQEVPFAFTLLTMDTHHIDGYTCSLCGDGYAEPFENVISCASRQVLDFVQWIQAQPFYENTTIVITGDHFSMDSEYFARNVEPGYLRHGYNCIINAPLTPERTQNRMFSSLDMFPTVLAALGCQIEGDQLGFGINLFSKRETLLEEYGYSAFSAELWKRNAYYERFYEAK